MTIRGAKYPRKPGDFYATPPETTRVLLDEVSFLEHVVDPACGNGAILDVLRDEYSYRVNGSDLTQGYDFLSDPWPWPGADVVMNPPFGLGGKLAIAFIKHALEVTSGHNGKVAVLLPVDFDSGITRRAIFGDCPQFALKIVLLNRIRWFNNKAGSLNHAWFIYDWVHRGRPEILYAAQSFIGAKL